MNTVVFGAGAIGGTFAGCLSRDGVADVTIVDPWFQHVEAIKEAGLRLTRVDDEFTVPVRSLHLNELDQLPSTIDALLISVKSYDTEWVMRLMREYIGPSTLVVSLQNGINEEKIVTIVGADRVVGCVVTMAAEALGPGHIKCTSGAEWPACIIGELDGSASARVDSLATTLSAAGIVKMSANIWGELWAKLTLNALSNSTSGLTGYTTRKLWADPSAVEIQIHIAGECALLAEHLGYKVEPVLLGIPSELFREAHLGGISAHAEVVAMMKAASDSRTGKKENVPSLLQDLRKGRRTEIDYLNGYVVRKGATVDFSAPFNAAVWNLVRQIERGKFAPSPGNLSLVAEAVAAIAG
jgi:2-dehydropantoate 2-reductase